jgi:hypothetical protein
VLTKHQLIVAEPEGTVMFISCWHKHEIMSNEVLTQFVLKPRQKHLPISSLIKKTCLVN